MTEQVVDPHAQRLRDALRELAEDTPSNRLARASLLAAVADNPALRAVALEEVAYPQAELDLHLEGEKVLDHSTRADWFGLFVARLSSAVNEVTKSMTHKARLTPGLQVLAPSAGSVRVVLRAPKPKKSEADSIQEADDTTAESRALSLVTTLFKLSEEDELLRSDSPLTAATQTLSPRARQRVRSVAKSVIDADWSVEGILRQRGQALETLNVTPRSAKVLYDELNREVTTEVTETLQGTIDGQRHSLSTMWFIPVGAKRAFEVAVTDLDLLEEVTRLSTQPDLPVQCTFAVFLTVPAGGAEATSRSRELIAVQALTPPPTLLD